MRPAAMSTNVYVAEHGLARLDLALAPRARDPHMLRRVLGPVELTLLGVGGTIGAGIFVVTGVVAHDKTGPGLMWSYIIASLCCLLAGLCYAEFAAMVPKAGSAYAYASVTMGELMGWIIGWDLTLEYAVAGASVARGWSQYFVALFKIMGVSMGKTFTNPPFAVDPKTGAASSTGCAFDLPAICITAALTVLLVRGIRESSRFNAIMVGLKVAIVIFVILVGSAYINNDNYHPYLPYGFGGISFFGVDPSGGGDNPTGVIAGAAVVFFAYVGFDAVSCNSEETINPQRNIPIGIVASLGISTLLYVGVAVVLTGMQPYQLINTAAPLSEAFAYVGLEWAEWIIAFGALVGLTSVLVISLIGQPRILMSMARDGLIPEQFFAAIHPKYGTPYKSTIVTGAFVGFIAAFIPLEILVELVSIGTLFAFLLVCFSILVLRKTQPNRPRPFRVPYAPYLPGLRVVACAILMLSLPWGNWVRLIIWLAIGMLVYLLYAKKRAARLRSHFTGDAPLAEFEAPPSEAYSNSVGTYIPSTLPARASTSVGPISTGLVPLPEANVTAGTSFKNGHHSDLSFDLSPDAAAFTHSLPKTPPPLDASLTTSTTFAHSSTPSSSSRSSDINAASASAPLVSDSMNSSSNGTSGARGSEQLLSMQSSNGTERVLSDDVSINVNTSLAGVAAAATSSSTRDSTSSDSTKTNDGI